MTVKPIQISRIGGFITTELAAEILNVRPDYMYKLIRSGALPAVRIGNWRGGTLLFRKSDVEEVAAERPNLGQRRKNPIVSIGLAE